MSKRTSSVSLSSNKKKMIATRATYFEKREQNSTFVERTLVAAELNRRTLFNICREPRNGSRKEKNENNVSAGFE